MTQKDIAPAFRAKNIIRTLESTDVADSLLIEVSDHLKSTFKFELSMSAVYGNPSVLAELCNHRVIVNGEYDAPIRKYLISEYKRCADKNLIDYRHNTLGWAEIDNQNVFLYDKNTVGNKNSVSARTKFKFQHGSQETYNDFLNNTVYPVPTLALAMAIGHSAVVVSRLKDELDCCAIIVNLCGASSTGKTTAEELLISAFASPTISNGAGLIRNFHSTQNAIFAALEGIHGLPIALDDTTSNTYLNLPNLLYTLATGEEKARCNSEGGLKDNSSGWSGTIVISSETPIQEEKCENQGLKARVLQTQGITWTPDAPTAELIKKTVRKHYGFTGIEFARFVEKFSTEELSDRLECAQEKMNALMPKRDNLSDRLEKRYALIYLTVELMNECFNLTLDADELLTILVTPEQQSVADRDIAKKGENAIREFIVSKRQRFDRYIKDGNCRWVLNNPANGDKFGIIREDNHCEAFILSSKVDEILKQVNINEITTVKSRWKNSHLIRTDKDRYDCKLNGTRYIHFVFNEVLATSEFEMEVPQPTKTKQQAAESVYDVYYDDTEALENIFKEVNNE